MDYQEAQIIAYTVELGMCTLTAWSLVNGHREVKELPWVCIYAVETCITKFKPLVKNVKNKKQGSLEKNAPTCKAILLWCLQMSLRINIITVGDAQNILFERKIIKTKEGELPK